MLKYFKKIANMTCVKEGGWRHFVAHVIGTYRGSYCFMLASRRNVNEFVKGFTEGFNNVKK